MPWRVVQLDDMRWSVTAAAERRHGGRSWHLVLSFKPLEGERRPIWADYPMQSMSRAAVFQQAEQLSDERLRDVLAERLR